MTAKYEYNTCQYICVQETVLPHTIICYLLTRQGFMLSRTSLAVYSKLKHIDSSVAAPVNVYDSSSPGVKSPLSFHSTGDTAHCNIS